MLDRPASGKGIERCIHKIRTSIAIGIAWRNGVGSAAAKMNAKASVGSIGEFRKHRPRSFGLDALSEFRHAHAFGFTKKATTVG